VAASVPVVAVLLAAAAAVLVVLAVLQERLGRVLAQPVVDRRRVAHGKVALRVLGVGAVGVRERGEGRQWDRVRLAGPRRGVFVGEVRVQLPDVVVDVVGREEGGRVGLALGRVRGRVPAGFEVGEELGEALGCGRESKVWYLFEKFLVGLGWRRAGRRSRRPVDVEEERVLVGGQVDAEGYPLVGRDLARVVDIEEKIE
jgi:hypothetical protein